MSILPALCPPGQLPDKHFFQIQKSDIKKGAAGPFVMNQILPALTSNYLATFTLVLPVIELVRVSVTVMVCLPVDRSVTVKVWTPLSPLLNV